MTDNAVAHVAILGAGPVGMDAALACLDACYEPVIYEAEPVAAVNVRAWGHVRLFTPWSMNLSARMRARLRERSWPPDRCPTGDEVVNEALAPLAATPELAGRIRYRHRVAGVGRAGLLKHEHIGTQARAAAPFRLLLDTPHGERVAHAWAVLDCTGTYTHPNTVGDGGIPAPGERKLGERIVRTLPRLDDPTRWAGTVLLVGAGKSAQTAARELAALPDIQLEWVVRDPRPDWGEIDGDILPKRQKLVESSRQLAASENPRVRVHTGTVVEALDEQRRRVQATLATPAGRRTLVADRVLGLTGYSGDASLYRQLQVHECYATGAPMNLSASLLAAAGGDCLNQPPTGPDVLRNPEPGFLILGAKSYGRLPTFLLRTGYQQVEQAMSLLQAAATVRPSLA